MSRDTGIDEPLTKRNKYFISLIFITKDRGFSHAPSLLCDNTSSRRVRRSITRYTGTKYFTFPYVTLQTKTTLLTLKETVFENPTTDQGRISIMIKKKSLGIGKGTEVYGFWIVKF